MIFSIMELGDCARFVADRKLDVEAPFIEEWSLKQGDEAHKVFDRQTSDKSMFLL